MIPNFHICGAREALAHDVSNTTVVVSITEWGAPLAPRWQEREKAGLPVFHLPFDDIDVPRRLLPQGYDLRGITYEQMAHFLNEALPAVRGATDVLVHCAVGASRSPAIALALMTGVIGAGLEYTAVHLLRKTRSVGILPNRRVVWLADRALGRNGALIEAFNAEFGHFFQAAPPFELVL